MKKNILVSGSHRSGSTWVGNVICEAKKVRYIDEPFNIGLNRKYSPLTFWFEFLKGRPLNEQKKVKKYLDSFSTVFNIVNLNNLLNIRKLWILRKFLSELKGRVSDRSLYKDPISIMSAEWIYENYKWDTIIIIRHPAAFIASLKVKNWQFNFNNFKDQDLLMKSHLSNYSNEITDFSNNEKDIIDQGILLWNTIHDVIDTYKQKYNNEWYFVKHEDLSKNALPEYKKMFSYLNLEMDENVIAYIENSTNSKENSKLKRNSVENIKTWKERLDTEEIHRIKEGTKNVWPKFYSEEDW